MKTNILNYFNQEEYDVISRVLQVASRILSLDDKSITVILVDDAKIKTMNLQYREKDYATDVLTFPDGYMNHLGDVIISMERCKAQADEYGHSFQRELGFLTIHGLLHTLGYDHHTGAEEIEMFQLQEELLQAAKLFR